MTMAMPLPPALPLSLPLCLSLLLPPPLPLLSTCLPCPSSASSVDADGDDTFFSTFMVQQHSCNQAVAIALARGNFRILKAKVACEVRAPSSTDFEAQLGRVCMHGVGVAYSLQCAPQIMRCYVNAVAATITAAGPGAATAAAAATSTSTTLSSMALKCLKMRAKSRTTKKKKQKKNHVKGCFDCSSVRTDIYN